MDLSTGFRSQKDLDPIAAQGGALGGGVGIFFAITGEVSEPGVAAVVSIHGENPLEKTHHGKTIMFMTWDGFYMFF